MPKLLEQVRDRVRARHYSMRTEETYVRRVRDFILFHRERHHKVMGGRGQGLPDALGRLS